MKKTILIMLATGVLIIFLLVFLWVKKTAQIPQAPAENIPQSNSITNTEPIKTTPTVPVQTQRVGPEILSAPTIADGRTALLPGNYDYDPSVCKTKYNNDVANTTFTYSSQSRGITFEVPYNKNWGNQKYYLPPFVEAIEDGPELFFGNIDIGFEGGCGLGREMIVYFWPTKTANEELRAAEKWDISTTPTKKNINGLELVEYEIKSGDYCGDASEAHVIVIGKKFNYFFWEPCGGSYSKFEEIIKTAKLIE